VTKAQFLLEERAAIIAEGCGVSQAEGMRRAIAQANQQQPDRSRAGYAAAPRLPGLDQ
jgi:hypothetical protein